MLTAHAKVKTSIPNLIIQELVSNIGIISNDFLIWSYRDTKH